MAFLNSLTVALLVTLYGSVLVSAKQCHYRFNVTRSQCEVVVDNSQIEAELMAVKERMAQLEADYSAGSSGSNGGGSTYVRWGRTVCPNTSELVYDGYVGTTHYSQSGGGVEYLCLHSNPEWPEGAEAGFQGGSRMYGVEYQLGPNGMHSQVWPSSIHDHNAPCAVCASGERGMQLMIPGRLTCPGNWTKQYSGVLTSSFYGYHRQNYACVDSDMEFIPGTSANTDGGLFYLVEADCSGELPCPPYESGFEIGCVICTR